jgi:hypothetical protein
MCGVLICHNIVNLVIERQFNDGEILGLSQLYRQKRFIFTAGGFYFWRSNVEGLAFVDMINVFRH